MKWFWYIARDNELFIDMDRYAESIAHVRLRLQGAIESDSLYVNKVYDFVSSPNHHHVIIVLTETLNPFARYAWEMVLHSDIYRTANNIMREAYGVPAPDVLISKTPFPYPFREPEATCECPMKHTRKIMAQCPAAILLRGERRTETFFGKPSKNPCTLL